MIAGDRIDVLKCITFNRGGSMKKSLGLAGIVVMFTVFLTGAQQQGGGKMGAGSGMGMMDSSSACKMMMMHMGMPKFVFPMQEGVIVVMGNRLLKYDKDLNLKKEAEIKVDSMMFKTMMQHMRNCPAMQNQQGMPEDTSQMNR
jgi:hypothetical protein